MGTLGTLHQVVAWIKLGGKNRYFSQKIVKDRSKEKCLDIVETCQAKFCNVPSKMLQRPMTIVQRA